MGNFCACAVQEIIQNSMGSTPLRNQEYPAPSESVGQDGLWNTEDERVGISATAFFKWG